MVEVTCRTFQGRLLLRPDADLNKTVIGALARAQRLYPVEICAIVVLSNHFHLLIRVDDALQLAGFVGHFKSKLAREVARSTGWEAPVWGRRYDMTLITDEEAAQVARLKYVLAQGVKEGLVARATEWPGVHSAGALLDGATLVGKWVDRTALYRARSRRPEGKSRQETELEKELTSREELVLAPLPCWKHLSPEQYRDRVGEILETIETSARQELGLRGTRPLGAQAIRRQSPWRRVPLRAKAPRPLVHAASGPARRALVAAYRWFVQAFREAARQLRSAESPVQFPPGAFPPALPFVARVPNHHLQPGASRV